MQQSRHPRTATSRVTLKQTLVAAGLDPRLADHLEEMPHRIAHADTRKPFREPGAARDELLFVRTGILAKFKTDGRGRRQIVALRFPGEVILPREKSASYGVQAIVRSEVMVTLARDFDPIMDAHPDLQRFFRNLIQRDQDIGYEWLVNCGRRDSTARVAHLLCETALRAGVDEAHRALRIPFTQQQIADITGQTSVNVNRVFADLERRGLIARKGREITFSDWAKLSKVARFQAAYLD